MTPFHHDSSIRSYGAVLKVGMIGVILSITTPTVHAFASNLIVSSIGCMTELDTNEVIMNNLVKSADESDFPNIHLAVWDGTNNVAIEESPFQYRPALGTTNAEITIAFVNPYTPQEFPEKNDLQFVIQMQDDTPGAGSPGTSAEFVSGGTIGCDGNQRVSARWKDNQGLVKIQIHDIAASFRLWAGWATGQGQVRLTPILRLEPATDITNADEAATEAVVLKDPVKTPKDPINNKDKVEQKDDHAKAERRGVKGEKGDDSNNAKNLKVAQEDRRSESLLGHMKDHKHKLIERKLQHPEKHHAKEVHEKASIAAQQIMKDMHKRRNMAAENSNGNHLAKPAINTAQVEEKSPNLSQERPGAQEKKGQQQPRMKQEFMFDDTKRRKDLAAEMERNFPGKASFRRRYDKGIVLNNTNHFAGCAFFVIAMGGIVLGFGKRKEKGRRDL